MRAVVEVDEGTGGDEGFAPALAAREDEGDVGDLLGEYVDGAVDPDDLFVGRVEGNSISIILIFTSEPGEGFGGKGFLDWRRGRACDVEAEEFHWNFRFLIFDF
jgi:hypothetical protein